MSNPQPNGRILKLALLGSLLAILPGCRNSYPPNPPPGQEAAHVKLKPESIAISLNTAFACSLQVTKAPALLAARFHLLFNSTFIAYQQTTVFDSATVPFLNAAMTQTDSLASLAIVIASPDTLANDATLCILRFKTLQRTGIDSIYFATSSGLTSLRNTGNRAIAIDRFQSTKVRITN
jgi:hypothetical protein